LNKGSINTLRSLYTTYFSKWYWNDITEGGGLSSIEIQKHTKWGKRSTSKDALKNCLELFLDPVVTSWGDIVENGVQGKVGQMVSSETQILRGPSNGQIVHLDTLLPTLNCIIYMKGGSKPTQFVDLESYGLTFRELRNAFEKNLEPKMLGQADQDQYSENFSLKFLRQFFPEKGGCLCKNPHTREDPVVFSGSAMFFDGRTPHFGPVCNKKRWMIFRSYIHPRNLPYHSYPITQYRAPHLLDLIHKSDVVGLETEDSQINLF